MKRIMIIGCCGAGKSTLARALHQKTGIELIYLDQLYWLPNYHRPATTEWIDVVEKVAAKAEWILDGNYAGTMDIRLDRADTIVFLDRSRWICLYRTIIRSIRYFARTRPDMAAGCKERFNWPLLKYIFFYNDCSRPALMGKLEKAALEKPVYVLRSNREVHEFLVNL
ncbi:MAG: hypothetical protein AAF587_44190 [Bacteroidota bacterium]